MTGLHGSAAGPHIGTCPTCGKRCFTTRADARKARKKLPNHKGMTTYKCGAYWHTGHLPKNVMLGHVTRSDIYPR